MTPSFDLATQGFCQVRWRPEHQPPDGPEESLSLRGLLVHAHEIADIQVTPPPALSGLLRVLYVLTARITGLDRVEDPEKWADRREELLDHHGGFDTAAIDRYFAEYPQRFELFHSAAKYPFLQDPRLLEQCRTAKGDATSSGVNKLVLGRAAGQAFTWQSHTVDRDAPAVPTRDAVFSLLAWLFYGAPGRCTPRRVGNVEDAYTKAGPLRGTVSYHPLGDSLFETLVLGLPYLPCLERDDVAPWESELRDPLSVPRPPRGVAGRLVGRFQHAVLLTPSADGSSVVDARITWAWRHPQGSADDPYLIHRVSKTAGTPRYPEPAQADRAVWRDLDGLLGENDTRLRPGAFEDLNTLMSRRARPVRIKALGFEQDRSQVKDRQYFAATTPALRQQWQAADSANPEAWYRLRRALERAEKSGNLLDIALSSVWRELARTTGKARVRDSGTAWLHTGMTRYWNDAETEFWGIVHPPTPPAGSVPNRFIRCALHAYSLVTDNYHRTPREIEIVERHRRRLWHGWESDHEEEK